MFTLIGMRIGICTLAAFAATVAGRPSFRNMLVLEQRSDVPVGFTKGLAAPAANILDLRLAIKQNNIAVLEKALFDVSTPGSALYGQHLSKEEVRDLHLFKDDNIDLSQNENTQVEEFVTPTPESISLIQEWLAANNITFKTISPAGDWIQFSVPVSQANTLLEADFTIFSHTETGMELTRTLAYSIPAVLQGHVDLIHPTITLVTSRFLTIIQEITSVTIASIIHLLACRS